MVFLSAKICRPLNPSPYAWTTLRARHAINPLPSNPILLASNDRPLVRDWQFKGLIGVNKSEGSPVQGSLEHPHLRDAGALDDSEHPCDKYETATVERTGVSTNGRGANDGDAVEGKLVQVKSRSQGVGVS